MNCAKLRLDLDDIQGNILPSFATGFQTFLFFRIGATERARSAIASMIPHITVAREAMQYRFSPQPDQSAVLISMGITYAGLERITARARAIGGPAFQQGWRRRWIPGSGVPSAFCFGGPHSAVDVLVILGSAQADTLRAYAQTLAEEVRPALRLVFSQEAAALEGGFEHFGFRDGLSNPSVRGFTRKVQQGPYASADVLWPGEFVLGYPEEDEHHPGLPGAIAGSGTEWLKNSSYLVAMRFTENPAAFRQFLARSVSSIQALDPGSIASEEFFAAKLMGRWRSGAPISLAPEADDPHLAADPGRRNAFRQTDLVGTSCPLDAHIRRAYPWGVSAPSFHRHRILRRGIPFSDSASGEQGLMFVCYQSSIERQFEHVYERLRQDPFIGTPPVAFHCSERTEAAPLTLQVADGFTAVSGAEYFLAPSRSAWKHLLAG